MTGKAQASGSTPSSQYAVVALTAAAMLQVEILLTRVFSVVFYYHYSFFSVSLVMSGLALGGILASRWREAAEPPVLRRRLLMLSEGASLLLAAALVGLLSYPFSSKPTLFHSLGLAVAFVPSLTLAGAVLATVFAAGAERIGTLYAADLLAAGCACLAAIPLMRLVPGPATILVPALMLALGGLTQSAGRRRAQGAIAGWASVLVALVAAAVATDGKLIRVRIPPARIERWNEHSLVRVLSSPDGVNLVIDRSAATAVPAVDPRPPGSPMPLKSVWGQGLPYLAYELGRPLDCVAIIGVGGGRDVLAALTHGAGHVDGYEINRTIVGLHRHELFGVSRFASWPEVTLVAEEGRVGIHRSGKSYDVIQASMIDTWAATAAGGFVLSENGLYTREAWQAFLQTLRPRGLLTMTRWYLPEAPAEVERLVALAAAALEDVGIDDAAGHVLLVVPSGVDRGQHSLATIVLSKSPFTRREARTIRELCKANGLLRLVGPDPTSAGAIVETEAAAGGITADGTPDAATAQEALLQSLLAKPTRQRAIAASAYDISPPTDLRPYFFLQLRPWQSLFHRSEGFVLEITFRAVQLLTLLVVLSLVLAAAVLVLGLSAAPPRGEGGRRTYVLAMLYFLGIGFGYILVQLALHQRLIIVLGHPTRALVIVLLSMLWGSGAGSWASARVFPTARTFPAAWLAIVFVLGGVAFGFGSIGRLEGVASALLRNVLAGALSGGVGLVLGLGFPLGVRLAAPIGAWVIPRMWAVNGAATIAGSALAAVLGLSFGSRAVLSAGLGCYVGVALVGILASRAVAHGQEALN